jgi:dolichyl-diphosphooligosaccharide---protein glycosyltransferase
MLTLTPVVCVSAALAVTNVLNTYIDPYVPEPEVETETNIEELQGSLAGTSSTTTATAPGSGSAFSKKASKKASSSRSNTRGGIFGLTPRLIVVGNMLLLLVLFVLHCTWVTSNAYSSPSVVLSTRNQDGSQNIIDDFREAYYWLRQNTKEDAVVASWWDYGYQIAGMADRPTLVDNNTWNNSK